MKKTIYSINELERYGDGILYAAGLLHSNGYEFDQSMYDEIAFRLELDWLVSPDDWEAYMGVACRFRKEVLEWLVAWAQHGRDNGLDF